MIVSKLTVIAVRNAKPGAKRYELVEAGAAGLRLIVQPTGEKSWSLKYKLNGSERLRLGSVDTEGEEIEGAPVIGGHLTLAAARQLASEARRQIALGIDPGALHRAEKQAARWRDAERRAATFLAAAESYATRHLRPKLRRWKDGAALLGLRPDGRTWTVIDKGLADRWRETPIMDLTRRDIVLALDAFPKRSRARFAMLRAMFRWLVKRGELERSPMDGMDAPDAPEARDRVLSNDEIRWFWLTCERLPEPFGKLYQVLLLTAQRRSEVAEMPCAELSADKRTWSLPPERAKNKRAHIVPLSPPVRTLIEKVPKVSEEFVFSTTGETPVSGHTKMKTRLDVLMFREARKEVMRRGGDPEKVKIAPWRLHDLRRTAATGFQRLGFALEVAAAVLNHREGKMSGVTAIYARHDFLPEKRAALEAWARRVSAIVNAKPDDKVVPMGRGRRRA